MSRSQNEFLAHGSSDESDNESGYDSEAAEISKTGRSLNERARKRRKLSHSSESEEDAEDAFELDFAVSSQKALQVAAEEEEEVEEGQEGDEDAGPITMALQGPADADRLPEDLQDVFTTVSQPTTKRKHKTKDTKPTRPGVIYLSSLPPYLRPSALRNILTQRGFTPITRLFLAPTSTTKSRTKSSKRQMYSEGWIEFSSHKTAKRCVDALNAQPVGGKKGGYYRDDVWNMRYLRGMGWAELMEGVQGERREGEARRDEDRRRAEREAKMFVEGVEEGKMLDGMRMKRKRQGRVEEGGEPRMNFRQFEVKGSAKRKPDKEEDLDWETRDVLSKIF